MRTPEKIHELGEQAVALRLAGKSLREIKQALGPMSNSTLHRALKGVPPPEWTKRPNAKDDLRAKARELRAQGLDYEDIAAELHVSKSSVSLWVRDLPVPERLSYEETRKRANEGVQKYWDAEREVRDARRCAEQDAATAEIGELTDRELRIAGAIAYWCEGAKSKPYRRQEEVNFINSDPRLILLFLGFLNSVGARRDRLRFRVHIHESADVAAATEYWRSLCEAPLDQFTRPNLKHHNPRTTRKNIGTDYRGCLQVRVLKSASLYRKIEGWAGAVMAGSFPARVQESRYPGC
jgi:transposase